MAKKYLVMIFEGWGVLGLMLLVFMVSTIPYGLCRGFGMAGIKAFYLTYILIYIIAWFKFPIFFYSLSDHNLGLVNLGLLIVFFIAVFKFIPLGRSKKIDHRNLADKSTSVPEIEQDIKTQKTGQKLVKENAVKFTKYEIKTIDDMVEALAEIQRIIEKNKNNLSHDDRQTLTAVMQDLSKKEIIFRQNLDNLDKTLKQIATLDETKLKSLEDRMKKAPKKERPIINKEIEKEKDKIKLIETVSDCKNRLEKAIRQFDDYLNLAIRGMGSFEYFPYVKENLLKARTVLGDILTLIEQIKVLEKKLIRLSKVEENLLEKEKAAA